MTRLPAQESPAPLPHAPLDALSLRVELSTSAAAYAQRPSQKQSALPAHQEFSSTRRAPWHCQSSKARIPEIRQARSRKPPQIFPPASDASALDPPATASCPDPQASKSIRASPIPTESPKSSLPTSCTRPKLGLPLPRQPPSLPATSTSNRCPFFQSRQAATACHTLRLRHPPHPVPRPASAHKIQSTRNASRDKPAATSDRYIPKSLWGGPPVPPQNCPAGSSTHPLREWPRAHPHRRAPAHSKTHCAAPITTPRSNPPPQAAKHPQLAIPSCAIPPR